MPKQTRSLTMAEAIHAIKQHLSVILLEGADNPKIKDAVRAIDAVLPLKPILLTRRKERRRGGDRRKGDRRKGDRRKTTKRQKKKKKRSKV